MRRDDGRGEGPVREEREGALPQDLSRLDSGKTTAGASPGRFFECPAGAQRVSFGIAAGASALAGASAAAARPGAATVENASAGAGAEAGVSPISRADASAAAVSGGGRGTKTSIVVPLPRRLLILNVPFSARTR